LREKKCPARAEILRSLEAEDSPGGPSQEWLDHVATCPDCRRILETALEIGSGAQGLLKSLEGIDLKNPATVRRLRVLARKEIALIKKSRGRWRSRWLAIPATGAVLALMAAVFVLISGPPGRMNGRERGSSFSEIRLAQPKGEVSSRGMEFHWTHKVRAETFRIEIYDQVLDPVFQSPPLEQDHFRLPAGTLSLLRPGVIYFWKVSGTLKNGQMIESEFAAFALKK